MDSKLSKKKREILEAVKEGTLKRVKELINGLKIKDKTCFDYTLLKAALERKDKSLVIFFFDYGCRVRNANETNCNTALHHAVELGDIFIINKLLKGGASISDKNHNQETPLDLVIKNLSNNDNSVEIINAMFSFYKFKNAHPTSEQSLAHFHIACDKNIEKAIQKFVKRKFPVNSHAASSTIFNGNGNTPLHFAVKNFKIIKFYSDGCNLITYLLKNGADYSLTNNERQTPVHLAYHLHSTVHEADKADKDQFFKSGANNIIKAVFKHNPLDRYINSVDKTGITHFHICCAANRAEVIEKFIENGEDINCAISLDSDKKPGYTPLHFAVENCHENLVAILLNHGADVSLKCKNGSTPLHLACQLGEVEICRLLLNLGVGFTSQDNKGRIPLHCAFYKAPMDGIVSWLLAQTPNDINYTDSEGLSIFHIACTRNDTQIVEHFLEQGLSPNLCTASDNYKYPGYTPMHFAVEYNRKAMVQLLLKYGADANKYESSRKITPLHMSCMHSHKKFYELCKKKLMDWTYNHKNHMDIVKLLLQHKADINAKDSLGKTPLIYLCELCESPLMNDKIEWKRLYRMRRKNNKNFEKIAYSSESSDEDKENNSLYMKEKAFKETEKRIIGIAHILVSHSADLNACTDSGESILHVISKDTYLSNDTSGKLAELLLKNKANLQIADQEKVTPLHLAVTEKKTNLVDIFLNAKANINAKTMKLMTPLHISAASRYVATSRLQSNDIISRKEIPNYQIVELLLKNRCNVDDQNLEGETALHLAISNLNYPIIKQLLRYGADMNFEDAYGCPLALKLKKQIKKGLDPIAIKRVLKLLYDHIEKLEMIGLQTNEKNKNYLLRLRQINFYQRDEDISLACETELEKMKNTKVDQYTSLYDILFKDDITMTRLAKNKSFVNILTVSLTENFPLYGYMLEIQFRRGTDKIATLLGEVKESLEYATGFSLPDPCSERIFRYLSNNDLSNLNEANPGVTCRRKMNCDPDKETDKSTAKQKRLE